MHQRMNWKSQATQGLALFHKHRFKHFSLTETHKGVGGYQASLTEPSADASRCLSEFLPLPKINLRLNLKGLAQTVLLVKGLDFLHLSH